MTWFAFLTHLGFVGLMFLLALGCVWMMLHRFQIVDIPNERSSHDRPVPKSGGIAIVVTFFCGIFIIYGLGDRTQIGQQYFAGFVGSAVIIAVVSFYDDIKHQPFQVKLIAQIVAASIAISSGIVIDVISVPQFATIALGWFAYPLTLLWIVGLTNAFNFMDGLDGLASGTAVVVSLCFCAISFVHGSTFAYITCYAILAGTLGFFVFNFPPAKIFMGDVGSAFLGFVFATLAIIAARYDHSHTSLLVMPLLLFHFIFDTAFTFVRRWRAGENVFQAHRQHLYQLLNQTGVSHKWVTLLLLAMATLQGFGAWWMVQVEGAGRIWVFVPFLVLQIIYAMVVLKRKRL